MRRWLFALTALLTGAASASHANYVIIRVLLKPIENTMNTPGAGMMGTPPGGIPPTGYIGAPPGGIMGSPPGYPPGGIMGQPPRTPPTPPGGYGGTPPGYPPGGIMGMAPPGAPPGGFGSTPPGYPPGGFMGMRPPGAPPGYPPGGIMGGATPPGSGLFGFAGGRGMQGNAPANQTLTKIKLKPNDYVTAVVEMQKWRFIDRRRDRQGIDLLIAHKWGKTMLYADGAEILYQPFRTPPPEEQYNQRSRALTGGRRTPEGLQKLALWCLSVGLPDKAAYVLDEMSRVVANSRDDVPPRAAKAVEAYQKIKDQINRDVNRRELAKEWQERLGYTGVATSAHYALLYSDETYKDSVQRRLKHLEFTFQNFYLWHALKGKALPMPEQKLVAILASDQTAFKQFHDALELGEELVADGFYARRDNLAIFAGQRLDEGSRNFEQLARGVFRRYEPDRLLKADFFKVKTDDMKKVHEIARAQTIALVDQALQDEAELASATHEGTRQLFASTGLLPRNVTVPEWLRFGLGSFFEMPKGPFPGDFSAVKVALYPGAGGPSWAYMGYFTELERTGRLPKKREGTLVLTITDEYFRLAREGLEEKRKLGETHPAGVALNELRENALARARTLSWGLTYFLANERFDGLQKYFEELRKLPRDLELDEDSSMLAFARSFGLAEAGLDDEGINENRFGGIAEEWLKWMKTQRSPAVDLKLDDPVEQQVPQENPGGFGPGAFPPGYPGIPPGSGPDS
jgi:Protein of unknown function (DUF1570)